MSSDLISRQAAISHVDDVPYIKEHPNVGLLWKAWIESLPSAQPERKRGKWVGADSQCGIGCPFCGTPVDDFCGSIDYIDLNYEPNYCPNCGERMKGADDE